MDVIQERVAGLDVHKQTVVATVRVMVGGKAERECRTFETTTAGLLALLAWLTEAHCSHVPKASAPSGCGENVQPGTRITSFQSSEHFSSLNS